MIHKNIWRPDTCGCEIEYEWDDSIPEKERTHTHKSTKLCPVHAHLTGNNNKDGYDAVFEENTRKNKANKEIMDACPELTEETIGKDGKSKGKVFKKIHKFNWNFDANRNLEVEITNLPLTSKDKFRVALEDKFGAKIKVK
jgi:hypothetical protein